jgi:hypothetical protein
MFSFGDRGILWDLVFDVGVLKRGRKFDGTDLEGWWPMGE